MALLTAGSAGSSSRPRGNSIQGSTLSQSGIGVTEVQPGEITANLSNKTEEGEKICILTTHTVLLQQYKPTLGNHRLTVEQSVAVHIHTTSHIVYTLCAYKVYMYVCMYTAYVHVLHSILQHKSKKLINRHAPRCVYLLLFLVH